MKVNITFVPYQGQYIVPSDVKGPFAGPSQGFIQRRRIVESGTEDDVVVFLARTSAFQIEVIRYD